MKKNQQKQLDSVLGFVIGDCLGVPFEFTDGVHLKKVEMLGFGTHNQPAGTWSDDTAFLLATLDCDLRDMAALFENFQSVLVKKAYTTDGILFDIGYATLKALQGIAIDPDQQSGNGSLMRILPYAFLADEAIDLAYAASDLTHRTEMSRFCCGIYIKIVREALQGRFHAKEIMMSALAQSETMPREELLQERVSNGGYVWHSLLIVVDVVEQATSFDDGMKRCIQIGGDTDTHCALVGAVLALKYKDWKKHAKKVRNIALVERVMDNFFKML